MESTHHGVYNTPTREIAKKMNGDLQNMVSKDYKNLVFELMMIAIWKLREIRAANN